MYIGVHVCACIHIYIYIYILHIHIHICMHITYLVSSSVIFFKTWEKYVGFKDRLAFAHSNFSQV